VTGSPGSAAGRAGCSPNGSLRAVRRLALATALATFALIVVGGVVRVSNSGLGCGPPGSGFHGWPFCNGDVAPGVDLNSVIEYSHRVLAGTVSFLILGLVVLCWRRHREQRGLRRASLAALVLVIAQAVLGGATVEHDLNEGLVAAHLGLAMAVLGCVLYVWSASRPQTSDLRPQTSGSMRLLSVVASLLVLCTIVAGGYMAGTQKYGRADYQLGDGAHHACGKEFPTCNGEFLPFGRARLVDIHLTHRVFMYLTTLVLLALIGLILRRRPGEGPLRTAKLIGGLLLAQLVVGALNVWLDEYEALIVVHLALGTLLWAGSLGLAFQLFRVPAPAPARTRAEAVPA
jgi:heme A synthase